MLYAATASVLSVVAVAIASGTGGSDAAPQAGVEVTGLSGALTAGDGPAGTVLQIPAIEPGQSASGTVTVANRGGSGGLLTLSAPDVSDAPGRGGRSLSQRLQVTVLDVTGSGAPELVYSGGVAAMKARTLDYVHPGQARRYLVGASFIPGNGPTVDDGYRGGSTRLELNWGAMTASRLRQVPGSADDRAPKATIHVAGRQDVLQRGRLEVRVLCSEECAAAVELTMPSAGGRTVTTRAADRTPGRRADVTLELPQSAQDSLREQLAAGKTVVFQASATARDAAGNRDTASRKVGLAPAP